MKHKKQTKKSKKPARVDCPVNLGKTERKDQIVEVPEFPLKLKVMNEIWITERGKAVSINQEKPEQKSIKNRKSKNVKIALIAAELEKNPKAKSAEIEKATGIKESGVRQLWGPIKKMYQRKTRRGSKKEGIIEAVDISASCSYCQVPLSRPFECKICKEVISGECKTCHYTNIHPDDAIP